MADLSPLSWASIRFFKTSNDWPDEAVPHTPYLSSELFTFEEAGGPAFHLLSTTRRGGRCLSPSAAASRPSSSRPSVGAIAHFLHISSSALHMVPHLGQSSAPAPLLPP